MTILINDVVERRVVDFHDSLTGILLDCCCVGIGIGAYITGTVTATIDVVVLLEAS